MLECGLIAGSGATGVLGTEQGGQLEMVKVVLVESIVEAGNSQRK